MEPIKLHVVSGNNKLGNIPNISFLPIVTCDKACACASRRQCYACKFLGRTSVRNAWGDNTRLYRKSPQEFEARRTAWLSKKAPVFFRWFVGGDCPDENCCDMIIRIARAMPDTRFLVFSKRYVWWLARRADIPENLSVVVSGWPGHPMPDNIDKFFPVAWMRDENNPDPRIPDGAIECPGNCENCGMCWQLARLGGHVVFDKH